MRSAGVDMTAADDHDECCSAQVIAGSSVRWEVATKGGGTELFAQIPL